MNWDSFLGHLVAAFVFSAGGILLFLLALKLAVRVSPFSLRKEIEEDQNVAVAILLGSVFVGLAMIVAAAIQG